MSVPRCPSETWASRGNSKGRVMQKVVIGVFIVLVVVAIVAAFFPGLIDWLNPFYGD